MTLIDFKDYLIEQSQERYKSFLIFAPAMGRKTWFAERVKARLDNEYGIFIHDLQREFMQHSKLSSKISTFTPENFRNYILGINCEEKVIIFDNCDFLINTWHDSEKEQFLRIIESGIKAADSPKVLVFLIQTDPVITNKEILNSKRHPRVLPLDAFSDL